MYPITQAAKDAFEAMNRQVIDISFRGANETLHLTENDITQGSFSFNRRSVTGDTLELGTAVASEVSFSLENTDGRFNSVNFEGARMYVRIGATVDGEDEVRSYYIPIGYFTIDEVPRKLKQIAITALDDLIKFDRPIDYDALTFPMTVSQLVTRLCSLCGVPLMTNVSLLPNGAYSISGVSGTPATYRQLLMWAAALTGTCAYMDWDGYLRLEWYKAPETNCPNLQTSTRFSSDYDEQDITITGVYIKQGEAEYIAGAEGYMLAIQDNGLLAADDMETVAEAIFRVVEGLTYLPFSAQTLPYPYVYPLDGVWFAGASASHSSLLTDVTFKLNGAMELKGQGRTATQNDYAPLNSFTASQQAIIQQLENSQNEYLNERVQTVLAFNELISNALGLYVTPVQQPDGSTIYYMHNQPSLTESSVIFTMTANGIAWTNTGWNDGNPVWQSGVTAAGDALFRLLSAEGINVSKAGEDYHIEITPSAFHIYFRDMLVTSLEADEMTIPKARFTGFAEIGKIRFVPYGTTGTNMVFTD